LHVISFKLESIFKFAPQFLHFNSINFILNLLITNIIISKKFKNYKKNLVILIIYVIIWLIETRKSGKFPLFKISKGVFMDIANEVKKLIEPILNENNYILDEVEYVLEGKIPYLRVYIDKEGYITIDDCVKVSNLINPLLDEKDLIEDNYMLDVCSKEKGDVKDGQ